MQEAVREVDGVIVGISKVIVAMVGADEGETTPPEDMTATVNGQVLSNPLSIMMMAYAAIDRGKELSDMLDVIQTAYRILSGKRFKGETIRLVREVYGDLLCPVDESTSEVLAPSEVPATIETLTRA